MKTSPKETSIEQYKRHQKEMQESVIIATKLLLHTIDKNILSLKEALKKEEAFRRDVLKALKKQKQEAEK